MRFFSGKLAIIASCILIALSPAKAEDHPLSHLYEFRWSNPTAANKILSTEEVAKQLATADVIFFGELHNHPGVHLAQMQLLAALHKQTSNISLSLEQFERDTQPLLDQYLNREIGEEYLIENARAWDNYKSSYRPMVEFSRKHALPVIAANAPKQMVVCVGRSGLDVLTRYDDEKRQFVAKDIDTGDGLYRQKFLAFMSQDSAHKMPDDEQSRKIMQTMSLRSYAAQAVRDDTMAESIAQHISTHPDRQVLHLNGSFHSSEYLGTVERLQKRLPDLNIAVIHPWTEDDTKENDVNYGSLLIQVLPLPDQFVQEESRNLWLKGVMESRMASRSKCPE